MWYPSLPDLLELHDRICSVRGLSAQVTEMPVVDEAILAPQRAGPDAEERSAAVIAEKSTALLIPLVQRQPFENCNDRVAFAAAQRFSDRNGFVFGANLSEVLPVFEHMRSEEELAGDSVACWIEDRLKTRFDASHRRRIFSALNALAETKEDLEVVPGLDDDVDRIDQVGYVISQQAASLFRLDEEAKQELQQRHPAFWNAWNDALVMKT